MISKIIWGIIILAIIGVFVADVIVDNQNKKEFKSLNKLEIKEYKEPNKVVKEKEIININTPISKCAYNVKISLKDIDNIRKYNLYLFTIFSILFDDSSLFDEEAKKDNIITNVTTEYQITINTCYFLFK